MADTTFISGTTITSDWLNDLNRLHYTILGDPANAASIKATLGSGDWDITGSYKVDTVQVVTNRQTGWTAATGTATRTTFVTSTVTLELLAQRVKALIDDLITHGLIGT
jgi:hypothetical protein